MYDVIVVGIGASGLFALANISSNIKTLAIEANKIAGKKLRITGGGRCNLTQTKNVKSLVNSYTHPSFVRPILYSFNNENIMKYFRDRGFELYIEDDKVYPKTQKADSVADFLLKQVHSAGHEIHFNEKVDEINFVNVKKDNYNSTDKVDNILDISDKLNNEIIIKTDKAIYHTKAVVIATGGASYPQTGSTGNLLAKHFDIVPFESALCHMYLQENIFNELKGVSVSVQIRYKNRIFKDDLLFAGKYITGPVILDLSNYIKEGEKFSVDFVPDISLDKLKIIIKETILKNPKKLIKNLLMGKESILKDKTYNLLPESLIREIIKNLDLVHCLCADVKKSQLNQLISMLKNCELTIDKKAPFEKGMVTIGGVKVDDIDNKTMCIKSNDRVMVIGEAIELVGNCGGYNLQFAFSSAHRAALYINKIFIK